MVAKHMLIFKNSIKAD